MCRDLFCSRSVPETNQQKNLTQRKIIRRPGRRSITGHCGYPVSHLLYSKLVEIISSQAREDDKVTLEGETFRQIDSGQENTSSSFYMIYFSSKAIRSCLPPVEGSLSSQLPWTVMPRVSSNSTDFNTSVRQIQKNNHLIMHKSYCCLSYCCI